MWGKFPVSERCYSAIGVSSPWAAVLRDLDPGTRIYGIPLCSQTPWGAPRGKVPELAVPSFADAKVGRTTGCFVRWLEEQVSYICQTLEAEAGVRQVPRVVVTKW